MNTIILDIGNGSNHNNDIEYIRETIDSVKTLQDKTNEIEFHIKTQLWHPHNRIVSHALTPTRKSIFSEMYMYCAKSDIPFSTSVFDENSRDFVLDNFQVPYLKMACIPELYKLITNNIDWIVSVPNYELGAELKEIYETIKIMYAVRKYPATPLDYITLIENLPDRDICDPSVEGLSDHTCDFGLYRKYNPPLYEIHYSLNKDSNDPFGNEFVRTFEDVKSML